MMASSPSCSSTSPTATTLADLQEADAFSDDSGVDVKPQVVSCYHLQSFTNDSAATAELSRRNKRKSSEPKKRKDVLLMKRFRWDTDEEDIREEEETDDVFEREERPSSGDSGCQLDPVQPLVQNVEKKKRLRQWRKPKAEVNKEETFRQSVICKNEITPNHPCTSTTNSSILVQGQDPRLLTCVKARTLVAKIPEGSRVPATPSKDYHLVLDGQEDESSRTSNRSCGGRPRNYKSMSRQRRIEANARERTRVHTISAAFESLRRAVPAYAHNQKLSKLAILRIASAYIVALACLNGQGSDVPPMAECVEQCTRTIQAEGRSRRRTSKD